MNSINIATFILDDDEDLLSMIKRLLLREGIDNYKLFSSEDLFIQGLNDQIHVCILDHKLATRTGHDILLEIKKRNPYSYVIGYTASKDPEMLISYIQGKVDDWVDKGKENHLEMLLTSIKSGVETAKSRVELYAHLNKKLLSDDKRLD